MHSYSGFIKPIIDYLVAAFTLIILSPLLVIILLINTMVFKRPLFTQKRIGKNEEPFTLIKFRSLRIDGDDLSAPLWGKVLRVTSIDEIPQSINILRGEMSLIGPRPLLPEYLTHYSEEQRKRHLVKPGITGLAQVKGRNRLSWDESLKLDSIYADSLSFGMDLKILFLTILQLFKFSEVNSSKNQTREPFHKD